jgi:hypothetical protein
MRELHRAAAEERAEEVQLLEVAVAAASTAAIAAVADEKTMRLRRRSRRGQVVGAAVLVPQHAHGFEVCLGNVAAAVGEVRLVVLGRPELGHELPGQPEGVFDLRQHVVHGSRPASHEQLLLGDAVPVVETAKQQRERRRWVVGCKDVHEQSNAPGR